MKKEELYPSTTILVKLLYSDKPTFNVPKILEGLRSNCGATDQVANDPDSNLYSFIFLDHPIQLADRLIWAQGMIAPTEGFNRDQLQPSLQQSWHWEEADEIISTAKTSMVVSEMMCSTMDIKARLKLFQQFLLTVVEHTNCIGIFWPNSNKILSPESFVMNMKQDYEDSFMDGLVNIRLYNIGDGGPGEMVMDTEGLNAIGLPDIQIHFKNINPNNVFGFLKAYSDYLYQHGDVLLDGNTVDGFDPGTKWLCKREYSLIKPDRVVINIIPDEKYRAYL